MFVFLVKYNKLNVFLIVIIEILIKILIFNRFFKTFKQDIERQMSCTVSLYKKILQEENMTYVHYDRAKITQPKRREGVE